MTTTTPYSNYDLQHGWMLLTLAREKTPIEQIAFMMRTTPASVRAYCTRFADPKDAAALITAATGSTTPDAIS